jgi:hypothetical protein
MKAMKMIMLMVALGSCGLLAAREINTRTLALDKAGDLPERYVKVGEGYVALSFGYIEPGKVMPVLAGESSMPIYEPVKSEEGKVSFKMVKEVKLPAGAKGVLLLGWMGPEGPRYLAVDDDYLSAKYDEWLLINTAPKDVAFRIGDDNKPIMLNANSIQDYKITTPAGKGVSVVGRAKWGEKVKTFYSTYWPIKAGERGIVIFFYQKGDRVALRKITDILLKPEEKAKE